MPLSDPATLRKKAIALSVHIEAKRHPACANQNLTARRARVAEGMGRDADRLEQIQRAMLALADQIEAGTLPPVLNRLTNKAQIEDVLSWQRIPQHTAWSKVRERFGKAGIFSDETLQKAKQALLNLIPDQPSSKSVQQKVKEAERQLIGMKIPGFFPTPLPLARRLVELADIEPHHCVLEPSAGMGSIVDAVKESVPDAFVVCCELQTRLCDVLNAKEYAATEVVQGDFLTCDLKTEYHRVVMNPPFENGQDIEHVQKAFQHLKPGGVLVSVMSEGPFFRNDNKSVAFRVWLNQVDGKSERLPQASFTGKDAFRQTGVSTRVVKIRKAA